MAFPLVIVETNGLRRSIILRGRSLPRQPITFDGEQTVILDWFPGNPVAYAQVIGPRYLPTEVSGEWNDIFLWEDANAPYLLGFPPVSAAGKPFLPGTAGVVGGSASPAAARFDNFIGVAPTGIGSGSVVPIPGTENGLVAMPNGTAGGSNGLSGVYISAGSQSNQITHNIIAYHLEYGIYLDANRGYLSYGTCEAYYNTFSQNSLYDNAANGIRLKSGVCDDGIEYFPNEGIAIPIITTALPSRATGTTYPNCRVQIFVADKLQANNPGGDNYGEGKIFLAPMRRWASLVSSLSFKSARLIIS